MYCTFTALLDVAWTWADGQGNTTNNNTIQMAMVGSSKGGEYKKMNVHFYFNLAFKLFQNIKHEIDSSDSLVLCISDLHSSI
jgi:hypothetical protein